MPHRLRIVAIAVVVAVLIPALAAACPLCKEAVSDADTPGGTASLGLGFYYSILFMVAAPFVVVGSLALAIFRNRRRMRSREAEAAAGLLVPPREARS
jgi:hypothetical protein